MDIKRQQLPLSQRDNGNCSESSDDEVESDEDEISSNAAMQPINMDDFESSVQQLTLVDDPEDALVQPDDEGEPDILNDDEGDDMRAEDFSDAIESSETVKGGEVQKVNDDEQKPKKKKKKRQQLFICLSYCKYECVRRASKKFGFKQVSETDEWTLLWCDSSIPLERTTNLKKYMKVNHFHGMSEICRKDTLARNMNRMLKLFPKDYNIFPRSWCLPADYGDFQAYSREKKNKTYISKPETGCQGRGIWLTKNPRDIKPGEHMLLQVYMTKPLLIDGFKFDMRVYVLVAHCDPFRIFVFKDGLGRFATTKYTEPQHANVSNVYMHLTNYAINKNSDDFVRDEEAGSKRRLTTVNKWLKDNGHDVNKIWADIDDVIIKTLISAHTVLRHNYRTCFPNHTYGCACFEILGFDVILDRKCKPYILEVNLSPSFTTDSKLDREIKDTLVYDTLNLVNFDAVDKKKCVEEERRKAKDRLFQKQQKKETKEEQERSQQKWLEELEKYEDKHMGNYRRIYPGPGTEKYDKFFNSSGSLFQQTATYKARVECARQQREELLQKQERLDAMRKKREARPESPPQGRKQQPQRPLVRRTSFRDRQAQAAAAAVANNENNQPMTEVTAPIQNVAFHSAATSRQPSAAVDTSKPLPIPDDEEKERLTGLLQRENLIRGLGIVDYVCRLLNSLPQNAGPQSQHNPAAAGGVLDMRDNHYLLGGHGHGNNSSILPSKVSAMAYQRLLHSSRPPPEHHHPWKLQPAPQQQKLLGLTTGRGVNVRPPGAIVVDNDRTDMDSMVYQPGMLGSMAQRRPLGSAHARETNALIRMADLPSSGNISFVSLPMSAMPRTSELMLASAPLTGKAGLRKQSSSDSLALAIASRPAKLHELKVRPNSFHGPDSLPLPLAGGGEQVS